MWCCGGGHSACQGPDPRVQMENGKTPSRGGLPCSPWLIASLAHTYHRTITKVHHVPYLCATLAWAVNLIISYLFVCLAYYLIWLIINLHFVCPQPIWVLGRSAQLLVVVFCPSVWLTGRSIWATGSVINQMEFLLLLFFARTGSLRGIVAFCLDVWLTY